MLRAAAATSKIIAVYHFIYTFMARHCVETERQRQGNVKKNNRIFCFIMILPLAIL